MWRYLTLAAVVMAQNVSQVGPTVIIPEDTAWTVLFAVVRDAPRPHWDHGTRLQWLEQQGVKGIAGQRLIQAANETAAGRTNARLALQEGLSEASREQLARLIAAVRKRIVIRAGGMTWGYYTTVETDRAELSATLVTGTLEGAAERRRTAAISIQSPMGRKASAASTYEGRVGQATAVLPLCGAVCEDGDFFISTEGTSDF